MTRPQAGSLQQALLRMALSLAARGWHVFPCAPGSKHPALRESWQQLATTDTARIGRWWRYIPYNIGIASGPSGLVVIDLDLPGHGHARPCCTPAQGSGAEELARLCREHGQPFPDRTFTVTTPSGGSHLYFTAPGARIPNSAGQFGPMIDVRSAGGYVIAPGSRITGKTYEITSPVPPAPLPEWITGELARKPGPLPEAGSVRCTWPQDTTSYARAALRNEAEAVADAPEGTRNDTLNRAAFNLGQLVGAGQLPASDVTAELSRAAAAAGLPESEIRRTIRNGMAAGTRNPRHQTTPPSAE
jgi:Bifunctional DNA primase/polymerase, N-terminal